MTIGINIPGMYDYTQSLQKQKGIGSGPLNPTGPTAPTTPVPITTPTGSPMGGYINKQAQITLGPQPVASSSFTPYRATPTSPIAGAAAQPSQMVQTPNPTPSSTYTPNPTPSPTPAASTMPPAAGPAPMAGAAGSSLQDPGQLTDAGKAYAARVTQNLQGNNPLVKNAQATEDTAAARRGYTARTTTQESLAQSPFAVGSAQYQRAMDQSQAGVNAANQAGQAGVNQVTRQATADNMTAANNLEDQQYGRAVGERTNSQTQASNLGNSITDPKAKYAFNAAVARGVDPKAAYDQIVGSTGTINEQYRGQSPVANVQQDATDWIKATQPNLVPGSPEFQKAVTARMQTTDQATNAPLKAATASADLATAKTAFTSGTALTDDQKTALVQSGDVTEVSGADSPQIGNLATGKGVKIGNEVYKVLDHQTTRTGWTKSRDPRHTDYTTMQDSNGKKVYVYNGKINDQPPTAV